jgi:hypothetical protein
METQRPSFVFDSFQSLIDQIDQQSDPAVRLACYTYLLDLVQQRAVRGRDGAAYDARTKYPVRDIGDIAGSDPSDVYYWAQRHKTRNGLPALGRRYPQDLTKAKDITQALGVSR